MNPYCVEPPLTGMAGSAAFKGAKKTDVEEVLDSLAALGIIYHLAAHEARGTRR